MAAEFDFAATKRAFDMLEAAIYNAATQALTSALDATVASARSTSLFKDRTGATRASIRSERASLNATVSAGGVSSFLENGTRPHEIRPKRGRMLAFSINGRRVFARVVHHPGTAERPFMTQARDLGERTLEYGMDLFVSEAIRRA